MEIEQKQLKNVFIFTVLTVIFSLVSCRHIHKVKTLNWEPLHSSHRCSFQQPQIQLLNSDQGQLLYQQEIQHQNKRIIGATSTARPITKDTSILLVAMGLKSSGGYAVKVRDITHSDSVLKVQADWITPSPDSMTTSALTSPCEMVVIKHNFTQQQLDGLVVEIWDTKGQKVL